MTMEIPIGSAHTLHLVPPPAQSLLPPMAHQRSVAGIRSAASMLAHPPAPVEWLIEPILPAASIVLISAPPKQYKTWAAMSMAIQISTGRNSLGIGTSHEPADVLYIDSDMQSESRYCARLQTLLAPLQGAETATPCVDRLHYTQRTTLGDGLIEKVRQWARNVDRPRLVVCDTYGAIKSSKRSGDAYAQELEAVGEFRTLCNEFGATVLLVTHSAKNRKSNNGSLDVVLGSQGLVASVDAAIILNQGMLTVTGRDSETRTYRMNVNLGVGELSLQEVDDDAPSSNTYYSLHQRIEQFVKDRGMETTRKEVITAFGHEGATDSSLSRLVKQGLLVRTGNGSYRHRDVPQVTGGHAGLQDCEANGEIPAPESLSLAICQA